jgi:hypothetical protein
MRDPTGLSSPRGVWAQHHRAFEPTMSNDPHEYICEFCGEDFETGSKKPGTSRGITAMIVKKRT